MLTFTLLIGAGTLLLALPISVTEGKSLSFVDAFFMAASATCVTGLATVSLADNFSLVGQLIILILMQVGGLGYMTLHSTLMILLGKSLGVKNKLLMQDLMNISSLSELFEMILSVIKYTLVIEFCGALVLAIGFSFEGFDLGPSIFMGLFHAISAFCNAGFTLFNNSLESFATNPIMNFTVVTLIILGGLGFIVLRELELVFIRKKKLRDLGVHSKIVLVTNFALISLVSAYFFFSEYLHALSSYNLFEQIQISIFQAVTTRTAGFNTISLNNLYTHTLYLFCLVMFIGASPGSTGGGIKTTTFAILFQSVKATLAGKDRVEFFDRTIPNFLVVRSIAIIVISLIIVSGFILIMMRTEPEQGFLEIFFEVVSAFATVGLSLGITPYLTSAGKLTLVILMFIGRTGPMTMALAIAQRRSGPNNVEYPSGRVMIG